MKRVIAIFILLSTMILSATAQERLPLYLTFQNTSTYAEGLEFSFNGKDIDISDAILNIIKDEKGYVLCMKLQTGEYFHTFKDNSMFFKLEDGTVLELPVIREYGVVHGKKKYSSFWGLISHYTNLSQVYFRFPDIEDLKGHQITKLRYFADDSMVDVDLTLNDRIATFNSNMKQSYNEARDGYDEKINAEKRKKEIQGNPTTGF